MKPSPSTALLVALLVLALAGCAKPRFAGPGSEGGDSGGLVADPPRGRPTDPPGKPYDPGSAGASHKFDESRPAGPDNPASPPPLRVYQGAGGEG